MNTDDDYGFLKKQARNAALREAAKIAKDHINDPALNKPFKRNAFWDDETNDRAYETIMDERRGETIAAEVIAKKIEALIQS